MARALVVVAHPLPGSLSAHFAQVAIEELRAGGSDVAVRDLYKDGFDPRLSADERRTYRGGGAPDPALSEMQAELRSCDILVLVFPTWWFGPPAILKGWFDRVWTPGVAFEDDGAGGMIRPRLGQLRCVVAVTTLGAPWWVNLVLGRPVLRMLRRGIVGVCAPQARFHAVQLHGADAPDPRAVQRAEHKLRLVLRRPR